MRSYHLLIALLLLTVPTSVRAQDSATVEGAVVDAETGRPLRGANVFITASMIGTATGTEGRFRLSGVPAGMHRLQVSMLGYETVARDTLLRAGRTYRLTFRLEPTVLEMGGVTVTAERDEEWRERLRKFERLFVGRSAFADSVRLLNPEVLRFDPTWWGQLQAEAVGPLIFENRALGYRVRYFLKEFEGAARLVKWDGEPLFDELTPTDSTEAARWRENRRRAYLGSFRHFLRALLAGRTEEEGFLVYRVPDPHMSRPGFDRPQEVDNPRRYLTHGPGSTHTLDFSGRLKIVYTEAAESEAYLRARNLRRAAGRQRSWIDITDGPATVSRFGEIVEPYAVTVSGYWAFERLAHLLPKEYQPGG